MTKAIRISDDLSVIVVFRVVEDAVRLTPQGFEHVDETHCFIYQANGVKFIGGGSSIRDKEDEIDDAVGFKLALTRALQTAFRGDEGKDARAVVHAYFQAAAREELEGQKQLEFIQEKLNRFRELVEQIGKVESASEGYSLFYPPTVFPPQSSPDPTGYSGEASGCGGSEDYYTPVAELFPEDDIPF